MLHGFNLTSLLVVPVVVINKKHEFIGPGEDKDVYVLALKSNTVTHDISEPWLGLLLYFKYK